MSKEANSEPASIEYSQNLGEEWLDFVARLKKMKSSCYFRAYGDCLFIFDPKRISYPVRIVKNYSGFADDGLEELMMASFSSPSKWEEFAARLSEPVSQIVSLLLRPKVVWEYPQWYKDKDLERIESVPIVDPNVDFTDDMEIQGNRRWSEFIRAVLQRAKEEKRVKFVAYAESIFEFDSEKNTISLLKRTTRFDPKKLCLMLLDDFKKNSHSVHSLRT
ncbi:MAG: hypothetical protein ABI758_04155 [Candidatus Woesebacteria bacterium]